MAFAWQALMVVALMTLLDVSFGEYVKATADRRKIAAPLWSCAIIFFSSTVTTAYVHDWRLIPFAMVGAGIGTLIAVARR